MVPIKKLIVCLILTPFICVLFGCATSTYHKGDGVIVAEKKIRDRDYQPHGATRACAEIGGTVGAVGGAAAGAGIGFLLGAFSGNPPVWAAFTLGGGAIGAAFLGLTGSMVGGGVGYAVDVTSPNAALYQYTVKPDNEAKTLTITQYTTPIPLHSSVHILEKDDSIFIKRK